MKNFFIIILIFSEVVLASCFISFIWFLCDNGLGETSKSYISKMLHVIMIVSGLGLPVLFAVFIGDKIKDLMEK